MQLHEDMVEFFKNLDAYHSRKADVENSFQGPFGYLEEYGVTELALYAG